jgi:uncharacterized protein
MSAQTVIDPMQLVRGRERLQGEFAVAQLDRLKDQLASPEGHVAYVVSGVLSRLGQPSIRCELQGTLGLQCQRCLEPMDYALATSSELLVVQNEAALQEDDVDDADRVLAGAELDIKALVEDEILLALPMAPRHAEGKCVRAQANDGKAEVHPFAALAKLKAGKESK